MPSEQKRPLPRIVKFYIRHVLIGYGIAAAFVAMLLYFDVVRLWSLISNSDVGLLAVFLLWFFNGIVFSGAQFSVALLLDADSDDDDGRGGEAVPQLAPISVARR
ncbi:hypothetical protein AADZ90_012370 [Aestuariibius sp. 2305UL40-4]|uniref:hypothetical protein n=1 Tax=Aestuariibius violaceus TaxID=3234132 RepID=UPI00345EA42C